MDPDHPEREELYVLEPDQKKLTYTHDTKMRDAGQFVILKEGHTLGNLLRMQLLRDKRVMFAGYKCPHPLQPKFELKVRTTPENNPISVTRDACADLKLELQSIESQLKLQFEHSREVQHSHGDLWG
jgi:DNA-directed RNA polymerase II subunit RPB11